MKTICFLLIAITMVFLVPQAQGAEWVKIGSDKDGNEYFYDSETLTKLPIGIIKVTEKTEYSDEGRKNLKQKMLSQGFPPEKDEAYKSVKSTSTLWEINCETRERQLMMTNNYSAAMEMYENAILTGKSVEKIVPDTMAEVLYKAICPPQEKK